MPAAYDSYNYPSYWEGREYEHSSEVLAIKAFLSKIPKIQTILEIGAGFGRILPAYIVRAKKVILSDPSNRLLKIARQKYSAKKSVRIIQSSVENLPRKIRKGSCDLVIMVRVLHHLRDLDATFTSISRIAKDNGYLILEFANKRHLKATILEFLRGNLTFPLDIFPQDKRSIKSRKKKTLPFFNYHPDIVIEKLREHGFKILEKRSVSNIRSQTLKKILPLEFLLALEKLLQRSLSYFNFGPSIFVLARKKG